jgi:pilus assembly protein CpaF
MIGLSGLDLAVPILRGYIANAFQLLVHVSRLAGGARRITRISELVGLRKGKSYRVRDIFVFEQTGVVNGNAVGQFKTTGYVPLVLGRLEAAGHPLPASMFAERTLLEIVPSATEDEEDGGQDDA